MGEFLSRLNSWRSRTIEEFRKKWWLFPLYIGGQIIHELVKDRLVGGSNRFIDAHSGGILGFVKPILIYFVGNPLATLSAVCITTVTLLVVHAYFETRTVSQTVQMNAIESPVSQKTLIEKEPKKSKRIFVGKTVTIGFLQDIYRKNTEIQGDKLAADYIGKWMRVSGEVRGVKSTEEGMRLTMIPSKNELVSLEFRKKWNDQVSILPLGEKIIVIGRIQEIKSLWVMLEECEVAD
jgi:hypothetical protein